MYQYHHPEDAIIISSLLKYFFTKESSLKSTEYVRADTDAASYPERDVKWFNLPVYCELLKAVSCLNYGKW